MCFSVLADGGLITYTGGHNIAVAAKHLSVPFVVITGLYKLCSRYAYSQDTINAHNSPADILAFEHGSCRRSGSIPPASLTVRLIPRLCNQSAYLQSSLRLCGCKIHHSLCHGRVSFVWPVYASARSLSSFCCFPFFSGSYNPSYIYRLLSECYHPEDTALE
jgi:translation initiation factor eIF-2B subunit beta